MPQLLCLLFGCVVFRSCQDADGDISTSNLLFYTPIFSIISVKYNVHGKNLPRLHSVVVITVVFENRSSPLTRVRISVRALFLNYGCVKGSVVEGGSRSYKWPWRMPCGEPTLQLHEFAWVLMGAGVGAGAQRGVDVPV